jgi:hypothetical protein
VSRRTYGPVESLSSQTLHLYSAFAIHDMGRISNGRADGNIQGAATGTSPGLHLPGRLRQKNIGCLCLISRLSNVNIVSAGEV